MKILQILPELNAGGVERGTLEIARALVQKGHDSLVVSNGGRLVSELEAAVLRWGRKTGQEGSLNPNPKNDPKHVQEKPT